MIKKVSIELFFLMQSVNNGNENNTFQIPVDEKIVHPEISPIFLTI